MDHYYLPLNEQPRYQARQIRSDVDYDHIESMDVQLVNNHIATLVREALARFMLCVIMKSENNTFDAANEIICVDPFTLRLLSFYLHLYLDVCVSSWYHIRCAANRSNRQCTT